MPELYTAWLVVVLLVLVASARDLRRRCASVPGGLLGLLLVVTVLGVAVRCLVPHFPIHANGHGIRELGALLPADAGGPSVAEAASPAAVGLYRPLVAVLGGGANTVFGVNVVLGGLSVLLAGLWAFRLSGERTAALLASIAMAVESHHVRLSASEAPHVAMGLLALVALLLAPAPRQRVGRLADTLRSAVVLVALAPLRFLSGVMALGIAPWLVVRLPAGRWHRFIAWAAAVIVVAMGVTVLLVAARGPLQGRFGSFGQEIGRALGSVLTTGNVLAREPSGWALAAGLVAGLVALFRRNRRTGWLVLALVLVVLPVSLRLPVCDSDRVRLQGAAITLWCAVAGVGAAAGLRWLADRQGLFARAVGQAFVVVAWGALVATALVGELLAPPSLAEAEYAAAQASAAALPSAFTLVLHQDPERMVIDEAPIDLLRAAGKDVSVVRAAPDGELPAETFASGKPVVAYRGAFCYRFAYDGSRARAASPLDLREERPECVALRRRYRAEVLVEHRPRVRVSAPWQRDGQAFHQVRAPRPALGFVRLTSP